MFSGIIAYRGRVVALERETGGALLRVACEGAAVERPEPKDSIAIDGVCLTAKRLSGDEVAFDVVPETLVRSTLGNLKAGDVVNVEYALRLGDRVGGHLVYGHVDSTARVIEIKEEGQGRRAAFQRLENLAFAIVEKSFVALNGVSLTVAAAFDGRFEVALIPETLERTTLGRLAAGDSVNVEIDPVARYAASAVRDARR